MNLPAPHPASNPRPRRCLLTGATGYVGGRIKRALEAEGWEVSELNRRPSDSARAIRFRLGESIAPEKLAGFSALVHCAYDFHQVAWPDIKDVNVCGSELLLRAASAAGVRRLVFISSISAFPGCRSLYGRAKLEVERLTQSLGGWSLRPGLVYGDAPGGMFGRLVGQASRATVVPLPGGGRQRQYLVHDADLGAAVCRCLQAGSPARAEPLTVAHEQAWLLRDILLEIARALQRRIIFVPLPWRLVWAGLRGAELLHLPLEFRSDSLLSLVYQNPKPNFNLFEAVGLRCRPFEFGKRPAALNPRPVAPSQTP